MAWNEPGKDNQKDNSGNNDAGGPPELDKIFKDLTNKLSALFGKKGGSTAAPKSGNTPPSNSPGNSSSGSSATTNYKPYIIGGLIVLFLIWLASGIFIVAPAEKAVVLQFGKYQKVVDSGPHWIPRLIDTERTVNVQKISNYSYSAQMLTKDQNIVDVSVAVQYRIADPKDFLFNVSNPDNSLQQATASALRQVIGSTTLDEVLTSGRAVVRQNVVKQLEATLALYRTGIEISDVALQPAQAPEEVKSAFDDAIKAQEDEQRYQNQAETYANNVVPVAQGQAKRIAQEAQAYQQQVVLQAKGEAARYNAVYQAYKLAPNVTKERLYLTTMEMVLQNSSKIFVDMKNSNNLLNIPLDKMLTQVPYALAANNTGTNSNSNTSSTIADTMISQTDDLGTTATSRPTRLDITNPDSQIGTGAQP
ncbi:MAG: FtsH protease activity modulator HflK [Gammaproteobacteria bacterium]|nr:FtsH protease activity modulator HflK [Gammaproteobacteria bacterium]